MGPYLVQSAGRQLIPYFPVATAGGYLRYGIVYPDSPPDLLDLSPTDLTPMSLNTTAEYLTLGELRPK
jgi:hypothetical protein